MQEVRCAHARSTAARYTYEVKSLSLEAILDCKELKYTRHCLVLFVGVLRVSVHIAAQPAAQCSGMIITLFVLSINPMLAEITTTLPAQMSVRSKSHKATNSPQVHLMA